MPFIDTFRVIRVPIALAACCLVMTLCMPLRADDRKVSRTEISEVPWMPVSGTPKVIYGNDDRLDYYQVTDPDRVQMAMATCALIRTTRMNRNGDGSYTLFPSAYTQYGLPACADEPFGDQPTAAFCSGFMAGPDIIVTAGHCYNTEDLGTAYFVFGFFMLNEVTPVLTFQADQVYTGIEILGRAHTSVYDYCVIKLDRPITAPGAKTLPVRREGSIAAGINVGVIGHPSGLPMKIAFGNNTTVRTNVSPGFFVANLDTYRGNSGSPVFNATTGVVEGVLVRGDMDFISRGDCFVSNMVSDSGGRGEDVSKSLTFVDYLPPLIPSAGTVTLDKRAYRCDDSMTIALADADLAGQANTQVLLASSSGDQETFVLSSVYSDGQFSGTIQVIAGAPIPGNGILEGAEGDLLIVTYEDEDDGDGAANTVTAEAMMDCTPPMISNVRMSGIAAIQAIVEFDTDEPASTTVHYGVLCDVLWQTRSGLRAQAHRITLTSLIPQTEYHFALEAVDDAGNVAYDDNASACFTFTTTDRLDYFTKLYYANSDPTDLSNLQLTFIPFDAPNGYVLCQNTATTFPSNTYGDTLLELSDDGFAEIPLDLGAQVRLYGQAYDTAYVGSNGYITFTFGDATYTGSLVNHFAIPRISGLFTDFNPTARGVISWRQWEDRLAVSFFDVPEYNSAGEYLPANSNNFQIELFFNGVIRITYLGVSAQGGVAGLSAGWGAPMDYIATAFRNASPCDLLDSDGDGIPDIEEALVYGTDPGNPDTDGDGLPDGWEIATGLDPLDPDGDNGPDGDPDNDTLTNMEEYLLGTHPNRADSDFDGVPDDEEVTAGTDPTGAGRPHSADTNGDWKISLSELLRVVQLFNTYGYHCQTGSEDGYAPGDGVRLDCFYHNSDYMNQNWRIELSELLRLIQLYQLGSYVRDVLGEDAFRPITAY